MSKKLHVSTDELRIAAAQLDMHAADLSRGHAAAHANMASAVTGFGTTLSAAALTERITQWEQETAEHHAELGHHCEGHRAAVASYTTTDSDSSAGIAAAWDQADAPLALDL